MSEKKTGVLRTIFIIVGIVVTLAAAALVVYKVFKKYFKITFECGDANICEDDCFCDEPDYEPQCCVYDGCECGVDGIDDDLAADIAENIAEGMAE